MKNILPFTVIAAILFSCFCEPKKAVKPYNDPCKAWVTFENLPKDRFPPYERYSYLADLYLVDTCKIY